MKKKKSIENARILFRQSELGVLSTHSKLNEGYPFGSVSTYMSTVNGNAIFYISDLAQHTKNLLANNKMCLTVFSGSDANEEDPNAGSRLSILGSTKRIEPNDKIATQERFFKLYPDSRKYQSMHDFEFFELNAEKVRFIGGFGDINWISKDAWALPTPEWLDSENNIVRHMNEDHQDAMQLMCQHHFGIIAQHVEMLTLTPDGCFLCADNKKPKFLPFNELVYSGQQVRQQLVNLTHAARAALAA